MAKAGYSARTPSAVVQSWDFTTTSRDRAVTRGGTW